MDSPSQQKPNNHTQKGTRNKPYSANAVNFSKLLIEQTARRQSDEEMMRRHTGFGSVDSKHGLETLWLRIDSSTSAPTPPQSQPVFTAPMAEFYFAPCSYLNLTSPAQSPPPASHIDAKIPAENDGKVLSNKNLVRE